MEGTDNDVVLVDSTSNDLLSASLCEHEDKPLMMLFKRLIGNDSKQNTVLTNAQIVDILQKEFNMDILYIHELEIDIYLNILKKFLKDWPQWDEFDSAINILKNQREIDKIKEMLEVNYESLKTYLQGTLKVVEPLIRDTIKEVKEATMKKDQVTEDDIVMELQCTRQQLSKLFYRRPNPQYNNSIFNIIDSSDAPSKIRVDAFTLEEMLNWPYIRISINISGNFVFTREMIVKLKHVLVNKKLNYAPQPPEILKTNFQVKETKSSYLNLDTLITGLNSIGKARYTDDMNKIIPVIAHLVISDLEGAPSKIQIPGMYRRNLSQSPYRRYLYSEVNADTSFSGNNYDLQLEETGVPQIQLNFSKVQRKLVVPASGSFLKIDCLCCGCKFGDSNILERLRQHFEDCHQGEPDWHCTKCNKVFPMENLTKLKWTHVCD